MPKHTIAMRVTILNSANEFGGLEASDVYGSDLIMTLDGQIIKSRLTSTDYQDRMRDGWDSLQKIKELLR